MLLENPVETPPLSGPRPVHRLADGTELLGEYQGSGFQEPKFLIRRSDGQVMQVPSLLYRVASSLDGRHDDAELAAEVAEELDGELTAEQFSFLVEEKLRPAGVVASDDDSIGEAPPVKADPLLALRFRVGVVPERTVWHVAGPLRFLFRRPAWVAAVAALLALDVAILAQGDLLGRVLRGIEVVIRHPGLVLALVVMEMVSLIFHEIGHVTACRFGGARPGAMGIGLYLIWPAYYSTVTDSYRLDRVGRLRTDLGGVYFNAIFLAGVGAVYLQTGQPWLLLALIALHTETVWQFLPSIRLDGYYILGDLAGVPDLFGYILPALKSLVPGRPTHPRVRELRPWPRRVIIGWVAATIPTLLFYLVAFLLVLPHALPVAFRELQKYLQTLEHAVRSGQVLQSILGAFQGFLLVLPWIGTVLITVTVLGTLRRAAVAKWGRGRVQSGAWARVRRGTALAGVGGLAALLLLRIWQVGMSLPASAGEVRLTDGALDSVTRGPVLDVLQPGDLLRRQLAAYAWLTGAFGRHPDVLDGSRELAVLFSAALLACLLVFAARRRVRLMSITLPLLAALVIGPAVGTLAAVSGALAGSAWTGAGLLVLTRHRSRHSRRSGGFGTAVGAAAVAVGVALCPLVLLPLCAGLTVAVTRGTLWAGLPADWRSAATILLVGGAVLTALYAGHGDGGSLQGADREVLLLAAGLVAAGGCAIRRLRPWAAAAASVVLLGALPWSGAGDVLPLVVVMAVLLAVLVTEALVGVPVAERPHPLLRAVLAVPVLLVTVVGGLLMPPSAPALPHAALADWITTPAAPSASLAVPALLWGDLVRDGVPRERLHIAEAGGAGAADWGVATGEVGPDPRVVARFGSGADALTVLGPAGGGTAAIVERASVRQTVAREERAAWQSLGRDLAASPKVQASPTVLGVLQTGAVDVRLLRGVTDLTATHAVSIAALSVADGEDPSRVLPHGALLTMVDGRSTANPAVARSLDRWLSAAPCVPSATKPDPSGVVVLW
jgi:putative peptide zinc metalloprotease protein